MANFKIDFLILDLTILKLDNKSMELIKKLFEEGYVKRILILKNMKDTNEYSLNSIFFNPDEFSKYIDDNSILVTTGVFLKHEENNPIAKFYNDKIIFKGNSVAIVFEKIYENQELNFYVYKITNKLD